jgi:hypothetical protein
MLLILDGGCHLFFKKLSEYLFSSSSESISAQANGRTPVGRVDEARREELPNGRI